VTASKRTLAFLFNPGVKRAADQTAVRAVLHQAEFSQGDRPENAFVDARDQRVSRAKRGPRHTNKAPHQRSMLLAMAMYPVLIGTAENPTPRTSCQASDRPAHPLSMTTSARVGMYEFRKPEKTFAQSAADFELVGLIGTPRPKPAIPRGGFIGSLSQGRGEAVA